MSNYIRKTKHPDTKEWEDAEWLDDYFGKRRYGVMFPSTGEVIDASRFDLEVED